MEDDMADGTWTPSEAAASLPLGQAAARGRLWAACRCGREAALDAQGWLSQGLARHALSELEERVRCGCGARRVRLEVRPASDAPRASGPAGIYVFR
jgi:hypothetical protein